MAKNIAASKGDSILLSSVKVNGIDLNAVFVRGFYFAV